MERYFSHLGELASAPGCSVEVCRNGNVHVSVGALTLRLTPERFEMIARTLEQARTALDDRARARERLVS